MMPLRAVSPRPGRSRLDEGRQAGYMALGCLMLLLGMVGAVLPLMPTTIFLILAAWCFGRSSPRLEAWMLAHPRAGPLIRDWRAQGAIPLRAKWMACLGMTLGYALFWLAARPDPWLAVPVAAAMLGCAAWIVTRPGQGAACGVDRSGGFASPQPGGERP
ncbi:YbaN family protein [Hoeflea olei]|uniref:YbaN family protein n=1 Tax=Hoeflea olei TaxID=1480615 RepID=UPI000825A06E|nr:YbaN family protein [Hoeflea olei]